jgi:hypothetical protein
MRAQVFPDKPGARRGIMNQRREAPVNPSKQVRKWTNFNVRGLYAIDAVAALFLSLFAILLTSGVIHSGHPHGGLGASIGVLAMTLPVVWRRRAPLAAAATLAAGAGFNALLFGSMVRCGAGLPAVFLVGYAVGANRSQRRAVAGLILCSVNIGFQAFYDPQLGRSAVVLMVPVMTGFYLLGRVVRSRANMAEALQQQSGRLRQQREETARLTMLADRTRISAELDTILRERIAHIARAAASGRAALGADQQQVTEAFLAVEHEGRDVLKRMREIVGGLHEEQPSSPQPVLSDLSGLLSTATTADTRLTVEGEVQRLPAGVELSGYRIVEHFLGVFEDAPAASIDVRLCFEPGAIELSMTGPLASDAELEAVLATARQRAWLHRGTLHGHTEGAVCHATARLPVGAAHG